MADRLVLASSSPRRRAILEQLGVDFEVDAEEVAERSDGEPRALVLENAQRKAAAVAARRPDELVLGADTVVAVGDRVLGKPADQREARAFLELLSGRDHTVWSGIALCGGGPELRSDAVSTTVRFRAASDALLDWYLATGEWEGKAGGYAIQGHGAALVAGIDGDYLNVVGLPVSALLDIVPSVIGR